MPPFSLGDTGKIARSDSPSDSGKLYQVVTVRCPAERFSYRLLFVLAFVGAHAGRARPTLRVAQKGLQLFGIECLREIVERGGYERLVDT